MENDVDILILSELGEDTSTVLESLAEQTGEHFFVSGPISEIVHFFVRRVPLELVDPIRDSGRVSIRHFRLKEGESLLIVAAHLSSQMYRSTQHQYYEARELSRAIMEAESLVGHARTVFIGDLNMNPFDIGMIAADGLNAVMDKRIAVRGFRKVAGQRMNFFYNPMWSRIGDDSPGPSGTFYYSSSDIVSIFWHTLDQVLLRPSLLPFYDKGDLKVVTTVGTRPIVSKRNGAPSDSDHLPLVCKLVTERG